MTFLFKSRFASILTSSLSALTMVLVVGCGSDNSGLCGLQCLGHREV